MQAHSFTAKPKLFCGGFCITLTMVLPELQTSVLDKTYINTKLFFVRFCMFLCLYLIQIYISKPTSIELRTRLPLRLEEVVGYVWTYNIPLFSTFRHLLSGTSAESWAQHGCRPKSHCGSVISVI
jgi:hypothetical protein